MLTYQAFGYRNGLTAQLPRIIEGFKSHGIVESDNPDFIYSNDSGGYNDAILAKQRHPKAKLILNVLDICEPCMPDFDLSKLHAQLKRADAVTVISPYVQSQLHRYFDLPSFVIWNPIKNVNSTKRLNGEKPYGQFRAAMIGRLCDQGKRASLGIQAMIHAGFNESEVAMIGPEYPGWGTRMGSVSDDVLNDILNSVDFVVCTSIFGGIELPPLEGMVCGAVPIICSDLTTFPDYNHDLGVPRAWASYPSPYSIAFRLRKLIENPQILKADQELSLAIGEHIATKMSGKAVAGNILSVYHKISS